MNITIMASKSRKSKICNQTWKFIFSRVSLKMMLANSISFRCSFFFNHRENGGTLGMVPLIINPVYTLYSGYLDVFIGSQSPFKGLQQGG